MGDILQLQMPIKQPSAKANAKKHRIGLFIQQKYAQAMAEKAEAAREPGAIVRAPEAHRAWLQAQLSQS
jgi:hypothetical protein